MNTGGYKTVKFSHIHILFFPKSGKDLLVERLRVVKCIYPSSS